MTAKVMALHVRVIMRRHFVTQEDYEDEIVKLVQGGYNVKMVLSTVVILEGNFEVDADKLIYAKNIKYVTDYSTN